MMLSSFPCLILLPSLPYQFLLTAIPQKIIGNTTPKTGFAARELDILIIQIFEGHKEWVLAEDQTTIDKKNKVQRK